jgi:hypothetical protein
VTILDCETPESEPTLTVNPNIFQERARKIRCALEGAPLKESITLLSIIINDFLIASQDTSEITLKDVFDLLLNIHNVHPWQNGGK